MATGRSIHGGVGLHTPRGSRFLVLVRFGVLFGVLGSVLGGTQAGCEQSDELANPGEEFTATELRLITQALGILPEAPPPSLTNAYADDPRAAALGQKLFFDLRVGIDDQTGCVTCHDPQTGFQDNRAATSLGVAGYSKRHTLSVLNAAYGDGSYDGTSWQFWDGRSDSLWSQALAPPEDQVEMGSSRTRVALLIYDRYHDEYRALFGDFAVALRNGMGDPVASDDARPGTAEWSALSQEERDAINQVYVNFGKSIAAYERNLVSTNSRFDAYYRELVLGNLDSDLLDAEERLGLRLFVGKAHCVLCHAGPNFTTGEFWNIAVAPADPGLGGGDRGRADGVAKVVASEFNCTSAWSDVADPMDCAVTSLAGRDSHLGAFRTPGLRDVSRTAPYMHSGGLDTLEAVIDHYDEGGAADGFVGPDQVMIRELGLTDREKAALVAFLGALEGEPLDPALLEPPVLPQ